MTLGTLIRQSLRHYARAHLGTLLGAAVSTAVLVGALVVGDSVRASLRELALRRLGGIHFAIYTQDRLFGQDLASAFPPRAAAGLLVPGVVSRQDGAARANRVNVLGVAPDTWPALADWPVRGDSSREPTQAAPRSEPPGATTPGTASEPALTPELLRQWRRGEVAFLNRTLARQLGVRADDTIIVRVKKPSALALDAVITPRDQTAVALRLKVGAVLAPEQLGDFDLAASQIPPANLFLPRAFLAQRLEVPDRANLLVFAPRGPGDSLGLGNLDGGVASDVRPPTEPSAVAASADALTQLENRLQAAWTLADAELKVRTVEAPAGATGEPHGAPFVELVSDRIFLDAPIVQAALTPRTTLLTNRPSLGGDDAGYLRLASTLTNTVRVLTYLANQLRAGDRATPYSMVTAADPPYVPADLRDDEMWVNQWLADDLGVQAGDLVQLSYYVPDSASRLVERTQAFRVRGIVPIQGVYADRTLMPEFPGLARAESTHDWNAGFPLVHKIRDKDEDYWKQHRGTPKAFVALAAGQQMWANRFGALTAIRYAVPTNSEPRTVAEAVRRNLLANLDPAAVGLKWEPVREQALAAANQSQDFGGLFLGFSVFLIAAALLLMALLFQFSIEQRTVEIGTLLALGFRPKTVRRMLLAEGAALALLGGMLGVLGGVCYARAMLHGLATIWRDAVGAAALRYFASPPTLLIGYAAGVVVACLTIWLAVRKQARQPARELLAGGAVEGPQADRGTRSPASLPARGLAEVFAQSPSFWLAVGSPVLAVGGVVWALATGQTTNAAVFFSAGALVLIAGLAFSSLLLRTLARAQSTAKLTVRGLGVRNCARRRQRSLATLGLLACGSFLIAAVQANRLDAGRDATRRTSGTGGFALIGESTLPVLQDLNTREGREALGLEEHELADVSFVPFKVRPGDDASCLNLNRAQKPRLLGVRPELLAERGAFTFAKVLAGSPPVGSPWELLRWEGRATRGEPQEASPGLAPLPAIGDAASIQWALGKKLGDTLTYTDERGREFQIQLVAALANSILQGNLIIDERAFVERFPSESGHRLFLIDAPPERAGQVAAQLSRALADAGLELTPAVERLAQFNAVQNTYLGTFQVLGGLGLLLGSIGLGVVVLRNVLERRGELALLLAVGFRARAVRRLVVSEHGALLTAGLGIGVVAAAVAVLPVLLSPGAQMPVRSLTLMLAAVLVSGAVWTWLASVWALRGSLLESLRNE